MADPKYKYKYAHGCYWLRIFHHQSLDGTVIFTEDEAKNCDLPNKFSILDEISPIMKHKGKYEFLLEYPIDYPNKYVRWRQDMNPLDDKEVQGKSNATGFQGIHSDWSNFRGLVRTTLNNNANCIATLIDGNPGHGNWYYSIGMYSYCDTVYSSKYPPGPSGAVKDIYLWIRATSFIRLTSSCRYSSHIFRYSLFY